MRRLSDKNAYGRALLQASSPRNLTNFELLPRDIQAQRLRERDPHGNIQVSQVPIEQLFLQICAQRLKRHKRFVAAALMFRANGHFFRYAGRSCFPFNFDAQCYYALGRVAALLIGLIHHKRNGYMARVYALERDAEE